MIAKIDKNAENLSKILFVFNFFELSNSFSKINILAFYLFFISLYSCGS